MASNISLFSGSMIVQPFTFFLVQSSKSATAKTSEIERRDKGSLGESVVKEKNLPDNSMVISNVASTID